MKTPRALLLTLAWLCLYNPTHARIWCFCDDDLCTNGNRSEPCPDVLPPPMHSTLLGIFFQSNEQGSTLKSFIQTMIEKGFDERKIAELLKGILPEDIVWVIKKLDANQFNLQQFLENTDKEKAEEVLRNVMDTVRDVFKNRYNPQMTDKQFVKQKEVAEKALQGLDLPNGVTEEVLKLVTKLTVRELTKNSTLVELQGYMSKVQEMLVNEIQKIFDKADSRKKKNDKNDQMSDEKFMEMKKKVEDTVLGKEMSKQIAAQLLNMFTKNTIKHFMIRSNETEEFLRFLKTHPQRNNTQFITQFVEKLPTVNHTIGGGLSINKVNVYKSELEQELKRDGASKKDISELVGQLNRWNIHNFRSESQMILNRLETNLNGTVEKDFMKEFVDALPETLKSEATDLEDIKNALLESLASRTLRKRSFFMDDDDPRQFCLKVIIPKGKTMRFCGHLAAQVTGFEFREGCHYEQMLGLVNAKFCRCSTYLCNRGFVATGSLGLCLLSMILALIKATA